MTDMMTTQMARTYQAARAAGSSTADACRAVLTAHRDAEFDAVVDLSWRIETGKAEPAWLDAEGDETAAAMAWTAGAEKKEIGE